jgi:hypothetical protein
VSGTWLVIRSRDEWAAQVSAALDRFAELNGGTDPERLGDCYALDRGAFGQMVVGLLALGVEVDPGMVRLAGVRQVGELL